jgi:hypothetical protein
MLENRQHFFGVSKTPPFPRRNLSRRPNVGPFNFGHFHSQSPAAPARDTPFSHQEQSSIARGVTDANMEPLSGSPANAAPVRSICLDSEWAAETQAAQTSAAEEPNSASSLAQYKENILRQHLARKGHCVHRDRRPRADNAHSPARRA